MIYFISAKTHIKIGYTTDLERRIKELQAGSPTKLKLLGTMQGGFKTENELHRTFQKQKSHNEWFHNKGLLKACMIALGDPFYETKDVRSLQRAGYELLTRQKANRQKSGKVKKRLGLINSREGAK